MVENATHKALADLGTVVRYDVPLAQYTTYGVGGPADALVEPRTPEDLARALHTIATAEIPLTLLGAGTNICIADRGIRGAVLRLADNYDRVTVDGTMVTALAGTPIGRLSRECADRGLAGLEFACSIPGSMGGGVVMNCGAMGGEVKDVFLRAEAFEMDGEPVHLDRAEMEFGYRWSILRARPLIVSEVTFQLTPSDRDTVWAEINRLDEKRYARQPKDPPCGGSVFKNPPGMFARVLLLDAGAMEITIGGARVCDQHANFVINTGGATAHDIRAVIEQMRELVKEKFAVELELENEFVGEW